MAKIQISERYRSRIDVYVELTQAMTSVNAKAEDIAHNGRGGRNVNGKRKRQ